MNAPTSPLFSSNATNRRNARCVAAAFAFLGLTAAIALPQTKARAQSGGAEEVPPPTVVLHLRAENAAPTRAELHERLLSGLKLHGDVLPSKSGEGAHVIRFNPADSDPAATTKRLREFEMKHAATHPNLMIDKPTADKRAADDGMVLTSIAQKSKADKNFLRGLEISKNFQITPPLFVSLTLRQPTDPQNRAFLIFVGPTEYNPAADLAEFKNTKPYAHTEGLGASKKVVYTPSSYLQLEMQAKAGKTYLLTADMGWGYFPYMASKDAVTDTQGIRVSGTYGTGLDDSQEMLMIPGGQRSTAIVVQSDKDGWYTLTFAGLGNDWEFKDITIKEVKL